MKIPAIKNCCPACSGFPDVAFKIEGELNLRCGVCGFVGPKETYDSLSNYYKWRIKKGYYGSTTPDVKQCEAYLREDFENEMRELKV